MKHGAYLINVSRGPVVDQAALIRILQEGHLGGAALTHDPEPPHPDSPLLRLPNVIVTPHVATQYVMSLPWRMGHSVVDQVLQLLSGE